MAHLRAGGTACATTATSDGELMDLGAAILGLLVALVVKVAVMWLGLRMLLRLYGVTAATPPKRLWLLLPERNLPELRVLWWSLVLFVVSEFTCGIEIYILLRSSPILTGIHGVTSGAGMALFALGAWMWLDRELVRYGAPACLFNRICHGCTIHDEVRCKVLRVMLFGGTLVALASLGPLFAPIERLSAVPARYALPFESLNEWYDGVVIPWLSAHIDGYDPSGEAYALPASMSVLEFRVLPLIALALAVAGLTLMQRRREELGARFVVMAAGLLAYVYFELVLYRATGDVLIGSLGHELGELLFLLTVAEALRRAYGMTPSTPSVNANP